jgi:hypothetical protein
MAKKGELLFATDLIRREGELIFVEGKVGQPVVLRSVPANRKGGTKGRCVLTRHGQPTKHPCASRLAALEGPKPKKSANKSAKKSTTKRSAAKRPARRARSVGSYDGFVSTREVGRTRGRKSSEKVGFAAMSPAKRRELAKKGARASARARRR